MASHAEDDARIIRDVAARLNLGEDLVRVVLDATYEAVLSGLGRKGKVTLKPFATFTLSDRSPRTLKHPKTGRIVLVPASRSVRISPSRAFKGKAVRRLETVLGVAPAGSGPVEEALKLLQAESYTTLAVPSLEAAGAILADTPVSIVLVDAPVPSEAVHAFVRQARQDPKNRLCAVLALLDPGADSLGVPDFRVLPNRWLLMPQTPEELAEAARVELRRLAEERGYFRQQVLVEMVSTSEATQDCARFLEDLLVDTAFGEEGRLHLGAALREAIENGLRHGNLRDAQKLLRAELLIDREKATFWVRDDGPGFDYEAYLQNAPVGSAVEIARANIAGGKVGGLGIKLLQQCVDEVRYTPPGNQVNLTKYLR